MRGWNSNLIWHFKHSVCFAVSSSVGQCSITCLLFVLSNITQCWLIVDAPRYSNKIAQSLWNLLCFLSVLSHFNIRSHAPEATRHLVARLPPNSVYSTSGLCFTFLVVLYILLCYIVPCWKYLRYTNFAVQSVCLAKHSPCKLDLRVINRGCMQNHRPQNDRIWHKVLHCQM